MDPDTLTCGHCGRPLQPSGASLYFCSPSKGGDSGCQAAWWRGQPKDPKAFTRFAYEEFTGYVPTDGALAADQAARQRLAVT